MMVPVGELLSDLPPLENTGALVANNVIPAARSYRPLKALGTVGGALTARAQGAFTARSAALVLGNFAGDVAKLYKYNGSTEVWDDVTRSAGGAYTTAATDVWNFTQFGDVVIAVNGTDAIQEYTLGSSTLFAALGGSPPVAKYITVIKDFVIIGNIASAGNRVRWSATGNAASWAVSAATQADLQDLYIGGQVQGLVGGEFGVVFQENAIRRMTYVGSPIIFQFDEVSRDLGCDLPGSIASYQNVAFFHSADGFKSIIGGSQIQDIGANKIDRTFAMDLDIANASRVTSTIDRQNKLYIVSYPGVGNTGGTPNRLAIYNFQTGWWAFADVEAELIYSAAQQTGYTLDTLDDISSSLDALPASLDSALWTSTGKLQLSAFNTSHKWAFFTGATLAATVDTGEAQIFPTQRAFVTEFWPRIDGGSVTITVQPITRNRQNDARTVGTASSQNTVGFCPLRADAFFHAVRMQTAAGDDWNHIQGGDFKARPTGAR